MLLRFALFFEFSLLKLQVLALEEGSGVISRFGGWGLHPSLGRAPDPHEKGNL